MHTKCQKAGILALVRTAQQVRSPTARIRDFHSNITTSCQLISWNFPFPDSIQKKAVTKCSLYTKYGRNHKCFIHILYISCILQTALFSDLYMWIYKIHPYFQNEQNKKFITFSSYVLPHSILPKIVLYQPKITLLVYIHRMAPLHYKSNRIIIKAKPFLNL